jgi:hypothetical protein
MWLQAIKLAAQAGSKIYANRQRAKMAMSEYASCSSSLGGRIRRPHCDGQGKIVLRNVFATSSMVHKFVDLGSSEHLWYQRNANI